MQETSEAHIGRRLREIRAWRGQTLRVTAELAGLSESHLSRIERGQRPIERRATVEALAGALRVAPSELTGQAERTTQDPATQPTVAGLRLALAGSEMGEESDLPRTPWPHLADELAEMNAIRPSGDYAALARILPTLIPHLHVHVNGPHRHAALVGLVDCYSAAQFAAKNLGLPDLPLVASRHVRDITAVLSGPEWAGFAAWSRSQAIGGVAREQALAVAQRGAEDLTDHLDQPEVADVYGVLHLTSALAATTLGRADVAASHVAEAIETAQRPGVGTGFGHLRFSQGNVDVWRTMLAVEQGAGGRAVEIARGIDPTTLPESATRRAAWWIDIGRGLAMERKTREQAVPAFLTAEQLAPQRFRANTFAREMVTDLLVRARRDAGGRELRGIAHRMGLAA
jgi:transcriptional regulator with XRE-family HTH domain